MEELSELLADGGLFDVESMDGGFSVGYDDVPAHEYADLVAASADAIRAVPGVDQVVHEDRELLIVRAGERVTAEQLTVALNGFWRAAARQPPPWKEMLKGWSAAAAPVLRAAGFRKQGLRWNRDLAGGIVQVIELIRTETDGGGYGGAFDVGVYDEAAAVARHVQPRPAWVREMDCQVRSRSRTFALVDDASEVLEVLSGDVLPLLDRVRTRSAVLDETWERSLFSPVDRAVMLALERDSVAAQALFQAVFEHGRGGRSYLHGVVARCGLPPLETGSAPDRTKAEEALLGAWLSDEQASLDHLRRAFGAAGHEPRRLDGSLASLDLLHRSWRTLVAAAQTEPSAPPSAYMALPTGNWSRYDRQRNDVRPSPSAQRLTEGLAYYLMTILRASVPTLEWRLADTSSGIEPVVAGLPLGAVHVVKTSIDLLDAALRPLTPEQERLFRRYNPLRADVERWLQGSPPPAARPGRSFLGRFRRG